jgi:hypothetical protein
MRRGDLDQEEGRVHVGLEQNAPVRLRDLLDRPPDLAADAAGRERQDVEPAFRPDHLTDEISGTGPVGEIEDVGRGAEGLGGGLQTVPVAVGEIHAPPGVGEAFGDGAADPLRRAGDDHDAVVEAKGMRRSTRGACRGRAARGPPRRRG